MLSAVIAIALAAPPPRGGVGSDNGGNAAMVAASASKVPIGGGVASALMNRAISSKAIPGAGDAAVAGEEVGSAAGGRLFAALEAAVMTSQNNASTSIRKNVSTGPEKRGCAVQRSNVSGSGRADLPVDIGHLPSDLFA